MTYTKPKYKCCYYILYAKVVINIFLLKSYFYFYISTSFSFSLHLTVCRCIPDGDNGALLTLGAEREA